MLVDLNPLLMQGGPGQLNGWFPIYDTLRGVRGSLHLAVRVSGFSNLNQYRDDSPGLLFFSSSAPLACYQVVRVLGLVDELLLGADPEHHWKDSFRASRISNEERVHTLYELSGRIRRQIGCKVLALGGNAVLSYRQEVGLEGGKGSIVVRGYGTACLLRAVVVTHSPTALRVLFDDAVQLAVTAAVAAANIALLTATSGADVTTTVATSTAAAAAAAAAAGGDDDVAGATFEAATNNVQLVASVAAVEQIADEALSHALEYSAAGDALLAQDAENGDATSASHRRSGKRSIAGGIAGGGRGRDNESTRERRDAMLLARAMYFAALVGAEHPAARRVVALTGDGRLSLAPPDYRLAVPLLLSPKASSLATGVRLWHTGDEDDATGDAVGVNSIMASGGGGSVASAGNGATGGGDESVRTRTRALGASFQHNSTEEVCVCLFVCIFGRLVIDNDEQ